MNNRRFGEKQRLKAAMEYCKMDTVSRFAWRASRYVKGYTVHADFLKDEVKIYNMRVADKL